LLDINVLLALMDLDHAQHDLVAGWFEPVADAGWATCAITQNGFIRIVSQGGYANPVTTTEAIARLAGAVSDPAHRFWPCDVSLANPAMVRPSRVLGPKQVTDTYLLALAIKHQGRFVTLDRRVTVDAVPGATPDSLVRLGG
jgi:toxin-antitoxin system PIN domain toxin